MLHRDNMLHRDIVISYTVICYTRHRYKLHRDNMLHPDRDTVTTWHRYTMTTVTYSYPFGEHYVGLFTPSTFCFLT